METKNNFSILIVDDEKFNIELAAVFLQEEGYNISYATNAKSALEGLETKSFDLILLDVNMPEIDGFSLCKIVKKNPKTKDIPIIFLTAQTSEEYISKGFAVGGVDYITKPFNGSELKARVKNHLQNIQYLREIQQKQAKLAQLSVTDPLTKLYNSLYFDSQIKIYQNNEKDFWIIYIALDRFDRINEVYGFFKANKLLRIFAKILKENVLSNALVARLHGVHFAVLLKGYDEATIQKVYKELLQALKANQELSSVIQFYTVIYHVVGKTPSATIYKNLHKEIVRLKEQGLSYKIL